MSKQVISSVAGVMEQYKDFDDWWVGKVRVPMFDNEEMEVSFTGYERDTDADYLNMADDALREFLKLQPADKQSMAKAVWANYSEFASMVGDNDLIPEIRDLKPADVWRYVYAGAISMERYGGDTGDMYLVLCCECEWEQEHGLQLVFHQGKALTRVSAIDGDLED